MHTNPPVLIKTPPRLDWIDAIKGVTILLVVAGHAADFATPYDWYNPIPDTIMAAFRSLRMPLFFMMAGFFFLRRADRPWGWWAKNRIGPFVYLFTLWALIWMAIEKLGWWPKMTPTSNILGAFLDPAEGPWFILALALYFVLAKALLPLPLWGQFAAGAVISLPVAIGLIPVGAGWNNMLSYFIMFQIGAHGRTGIIWIANRATIWWALIGALAWVGSLGGMMLLGGDFISPMRIPVTISGVIVGILGVVLIHRWAPWLGLTWFGKRTLTIYLIHCPVIGVLYGLLSDLPATSIVGWVMPVLGFSVALAVSICLGVVLRKIPGVLTAPWRGESVQTLPAKRALGAT